MSGDDDTGDTEELAAQVELLREENRRLRESYARAKRAQYRRVAAGLGGLGLLAILAAVAFPVARTVLLALGATGVFGGLLTYYLTPERFISASVGTGVYVALASNFEDLSAELGLEDPLLYVPAGETGSRVRLFRPQRAAFEVPDAGALESVFVVTEEAGQRGIALEPTGRALFEEFERALEAPLGSSLDELLSQLRDGVLEQFEIADSLAFDADSDNGRVTLEFDGGVYGGVSQFDHPAVSFVAIGLVRHLGCPVRVETGRTDGVVTFRWEADDPSE